jgi:outer membrane protein
MTYTLRSIAFIAFGALLAHSALALASTARAASSTLPVPNVAVVDYERVLKECEAGKDVVRQIDAYRKEFQAEVRREEDKLRKVEDELKQQRATLPPDDFDKKRRAFEDRVITLQRRAQDSVRALESTFQESINKIHDMLLPQLEELTRKQGYNVVIDKTKVAIVLKTLDVTEEAIAALNKKVPKLKVAKPTIK